MITALLTGRGNNTLKDKNIIPICEKPLLYYPAVAALHSELIDEYYVSSDDDKILNLACELGYKKIKRPPELATPTSQHIDCINHALQYFQTDILVVLLANNVTIKTEWIDDCITMLQGNSAVVPVYKDNDHHPLRAKKIENGCLEPFLYGKVSTNRQDLEPCYFLAHNFWVLKLPLTNGQPPWGFMGNKIKPYIIEQSIDIHDKDDIARAEQWVKENL